MKTLLKIGALSFALIASLFLLNTVTNAATDTGQVKLQITGMSGTCEYGKNIDLGSYAYSTTAHTASWLFLSTTGTTSGTNSWLCIDSYGVASWTLTIQSSILTGTYGQTIPAANVKIYNNQATVTNGACSGVTTTTNTAGTSIASAVTVLGKTGNQGQVCTIQATGLKLSVDIPANQAIGLYTGILTINVPSL